MDNIIQCECGVKVRLPENSADVAVRCPRCHASLVVVACAPALMGAGANAGSSTGLLCPVCQSVIGSEEPAEMCPECHQTHHAECWTEMGGCATYGCKKAPAFSKEATSASPPLSAWGDTKPCPICGEQIKSIAIKCRYCQTDFGTVDPLSTADMRARLEKGNSQKSMRTSCVALFIFSVIGLLAPITAIISLAWVLPKRKQLAQAGPVYLVLGYCSVILSVLYSLLMLMFVVF